MVNRFFSVFVLLAFLGAAFLCEADSQDAQLTKEKLAAIEKEIESLRSQAMRLSAQENSILATLNQYELQSQIQAQMIALLDLKQKKTQEDIALLERKFQDLRRNLQVQEADLTRRLVEAYKLGEFNYLKLLLRVNSAADLVRSYQYITFLAKDDNRKVQKYRESIQEMEQTRLRLEQENRNLALLKNDSQDIQKALQLSRREKLRLLAAIQDEKEMHLRALSDLRTAASNLQTFFVNVGPSALNAQGASLASSKGFLDWPVRGNVIREFGMYKHPRFGTVTMSNGIEIAAREGTHVRAVYDGQVVFAEWFKGYGQCIILSHAQNYYTLYGHNSLLLVQRGNMVGRGQVISRVGSTGALSGSSLYFEIRRRDEPQNPFEWLRR
jgi:septal ring factor EnvC (AmiA/AmiB activator)